MVSNAAGTVGRMLTLALEISACVMSGRQKQRRNDGERWLGRSVQWGILGSATLRPSSPASVECSRCIQDMVELGVRKACHTMKKYVL